mgnify:CR=1 FL=1
MKLSELIANVKIRVGQYDIDLEELDVAAYKMIVEDQSSEFVAKYLPHEIRRRIVINTSPYVFTTDIPLWISEVIPVEIYSASSMLHSYGLGLNIAEATTRQTFLWEYESPNLYVEFTGNFSTLSLHRITLTQISGEDDYEINFLDDKAKPYLIEDVAGRAMQALGRGRRSAKITDLTFELDGDAIVSEGVELVNTNLEKMQAVSKWLLAV